MTTIETLKTRLENYSDESHTHGVKKRTHAMSNEISRVELDAKLELIETRMDGRVTRIEESNARIEAAISSLKLTTIVTAISAVLAIAAVNVGIMQGMFGAFESGKNTAIAIAQTAEQQRQIAEQLKQSTEQQHQIADQVKQTQDDIRAIRSQMTR